MDRGDEQAVHAAPSNRHRKAAFGRPRAKENEAVVAVTEPEGPAVILGPALLTLIRAHLRPRPTAFRHAAER